MKKYMVLYMGVSENSGFSPQIIQFNRFSIIFTIHFGGPLFLETSISQQVHWLDEPWGNPSSFSAQILRRGISPVQKNLESMIDSNLPKLL